MKIPLGGEKAIQIGRPAGAVFVRTKNPAIFDAFAKIAGGKADKVKKIEGPEGAEVLEIQVPDNQFKLKPVVAKTDKWLLVATDKAELARALGAAKAGDITSNEDFKALAKELPLPAKLNELSFVSPKLVSEAARATREFSKASPKEGKRLLDGLAKAMGDGKSVGQIAVRVNDPKGVQWISVGDRKPAMPAMGPATGVAAAGVGVAIAVPAFLRARENSRGRACEENLAKIDGAKEQYALEFKLAKDAPVTMENLTKPPGTSGEGMGYLKKEPQCPSGGKYTLQPIGENPTCSIGTSNAPFEPHILK